MKAENRQMLDNLENEKLAKSHQDRSHHGDKDVTANQIATLEAKLLEYSRTISKLLSLLEVIGSHISSGNMEQERLQLMMKCERLSSHRRRLEAALQFCHSHSLVVSSDDDASTGAPPTQHQLHNKLKKPHK